MGRYSIIGSKTRSDLALLPVQHRRDQSPGARELRRSCEKLKQGALDSLRALLAECRVEISWRRSRRWFLPLGLFGYLGYSTVGSIEKLPDDNPYKLGIPDGILVRPTIVCIFDNVLDTVTVVTPVWPDDAEPHAAYDAAAARLAAVLDDFDQSLPPSRASDEKPQALASWDGNMTREQCLAMVETAKEYIRAGEIFQVVPSMRFTVPFALPPFALYRALRRLNPSPFMFFRLRRLRGGRPKPRDHGAPAGRQLPRSVPSPARVAAARRKKKTSNSRKNCSPIRKNVPSI